MKKMDDRQLSAATNILTYGGAGGAVAGYLTVTEWAAVVGAIVAVVGMVATVWHKVRMVQIEQQRLEMDRAAQEQGR